MAATIKSIAAEAGVSIATVSHVINKTRYVSPDLVAKVEAIIEKSGYKDKIAEKHGNNLRTGRLSEVALVVPGLSDSSSYRLATLLSRRLAQDGFVLASYFTEDDPRREKHILEGLVGNKRMAGMVLKPASGVASAYAELLGSGLPLVCLGRSVEGLEVDRVLPENEEAIYKGATHLLKFGHERIALLLEKSAPSVRSERLLGFRRALEERGAAFDESLAVELDPADPSCLAALMGAFDVNPPTAVIAGGDRLTLLTLQALEELGLECPKDVSVIGYGAEELCSLAAAPLTALEEDIESMVGLAAERLLARMGGEPPRPREFRVPVGLAIRKSTQIIGRGPFGESAVSPDELELSEAEIESLRVGDYRVAISFHYCGTAWASLHEEGIRETLKKYGIKVVAVTDAHFDPLLQVTQLEGIAMQRPDAIIAIPADDEVTAPKFREISRQSKLIFISHIPEGFSKEDYASCVSVNEKENGNNAGLLLGELFKGREGGKLGFLKHGTHFYGTHLRDMVAEQTIVENFPGLEIVDSGFFYDIEKAYAVCKEMLTRHPEIQGLYVSWERPALEAIRALKELGREDVQIVTFDLDVEIAKYLARGEMVRGLSTQRPYEQGQAVALATAKAILGTGQYKYIGVPPYVVQPKNLSRAWRDIVHERMPEELENILRDNLRKND